MLYAYFYFCTFLEFKYLAPGRKSVIMKKIKDVRMDAVIKGFLIVYCILILMICSINEPEAVGEWDDYCLPIASIFNDHNFTISPEDLEVCKTLFPKWESYVDDYGLSGYFSRSGDGEMPWYFPTYSIACIPFVWILSWFELPTIFTFPYTNLFFLMFSIIFAYKYLKVDEKKKALLVLFLSINPIVFYISWVSAEVFIFSMLVIACVCWYNKWDRRAAVFVSIAGMLNPTIMSIGIIMIIDYAIRVLYRKEEKDTWVSYIKTQLPDAIKYGCCYIIGVVPMIYNYYNVGHINLTASLSGFTQGNESTKERFLAYLFDLNYGILPYYPIVLVISFLLLIVAVVKRHVKYAEWFIAFLINVMLYSIMVHINCGMSGIARYSSWGIVLLLFAIVLFFDELAGTLKLKRFFCAALLAEILVTGTVVMKYNPNRALNAPYTCMTPIAEWVLYRFPGLYNPLFSTFNSRVNHEDGAYNYAERLPIVFETEGGYVKKILATEDNKEQLLTDYREKNDSNRWLIDKINNLDSNLRYISVPLKFQIVKSKDYSLGTDIYFDAEKGNSSDYVINGVSNGESWGAWTDKKMVTIRFNSTSDCNTISGSIACGAFNGSQDVIIRANGEEVLSEDDYVGNELSFDFANPGNGNIIEISIELPDAKSPAELGMGEDIRVLGLGLSHMIFQEKN